MDSAADSFRLDFFLRFLFLRRAISEFELSGFPYKLEDLAPGSDFLSKGMGDVHKEMGMLPYKPGKAEMMFGVKSNSLTVMQKYNRNDYCFPNSENNPEIRAGKPGCGNS